MKRKIYRVLSILVLIVTFFAVINISRVFAQGEEPTPTISVEIFEPTEETPFTESPTPTETIVPTTVEPTATPTSATSSEESSSKDVINTTVDIKTQYPWNKKIPIILHITPKLSGEKLVIRWQNRLGIKTNISSVTIDNPVAGHTYSKRFVLEPIAAGRQRVVADVILTTYNSNYVTSQSIPFYFTSDFAVYPKTSQYIAYTISMWVGIIGVFFMLLPFATYKGIIYLKDKVFPKWLENKVQVPS